MSYAGFKSAYPIGTAIVTVQGISNPYGVQCVNVPRAYAAYLYPNIPFAQTISSGDARTLFANANPQYFQKIANNPSDPNQLPEQGDIMVFDGTPKAGYTNQFVNPAGHTGLYDSGDANGYNLLQVNAPNEGQGVNITRYAWKYRPCIGWLRPIQQVTATPPATQGGSDMVTQATLTFIFNQLLGRAPDAGAISHYVGNYSADFVINDVSGSAEHKQHQANLDAQAQATADQLAQIPALESHINDLSKQVADLQAQLKNQPTGGLDASTKAEIDNTNSIVQNIWNKLTSIFK